MFSDFKNKGIYIKAKELYERISSCLSGEVPYVLKDQIIRSSISIILNFSEGYGRFSKNDKKHFYITARASLNETVACFDLIQIHTKIKQVEYDKITGLFDELYKMLSGLINSHK